MADETRSLAGAYGQDQYRARRDEALRWLNRPDEPLAEPAPKVETGQPAKERPGAIKAGAVTFWDLFQQGAQNIADAAIPRRPPAPGVGGIGSNVAAGASDAGQAVLGALQIVLSAPMGAAKAVTQAIVNYAPGLESSVALDPTTAEKVRVMLGAPGIILDPKIRGAEGEAAQAIVAEMKKPMTYEELIELVAGFAVPFAPAAAAKGARAIRGKGAAVAPEPAAPPARAPLALPERTEPLVTPPPGTVGGMTPAEVAIELRTVLEQVPRGEAPPARLTRPFQEDAPLTIQPGEAGATSGLLDPQGRPLAPAVVEAIAERDRLRAMERTPLDAPARTAKPGGPDQPAAGIPDVSAPTGDLASAFDVAQKKTQAAAEAALPDWLKADPAPARPIAGGAPAVPEAPPAPPTAVMDTLMLMWNDLKEAAPGRRHLVTDDVGKVEGGLSEPSTYPEWMNALTTKRTRGEADKLMAAIDNVIDGKVDGPLERAVQDYAARNWERFDLERFGGGLSSFADETGRVTPEVMAALARMALGAAMGGTQGDTPEERILGALVGAGIGAALSKRLATKMAEAYKSSGLADETGAIGDPRVLRTLRGRLSGLDKATQSDLATIGAVHMWKGATTPEAFRAAMSKEFGTSVAPHLTDALHREAEARLHQVLARVELPATEKLAELFHAGEDMATWYDKAAKEIYRRFGRKNGDMFIQMLAATSPNTTVKANITKALSAFEDVMTGRRSKDKPFDTGMAAHDDNLNRILRGEEISGPKVGPFARAIRGDESAVVVDTWMVRAYGGSAAAAKSPGPVLVQFITEHTQALARELSEQRGELVTARQVQAAIWTGIKRADEGSGVWVAPLHDAIDLALSKRGGGVRGAVPVEAVRAFELLMEEAAQKEGFTYRGQTGNATVDTLAALARVASGALLGAATGDDPESMVRNALLGAGLGGALSRRVAARLAASLRKGGKEPAPAAPGTFAQAIGDALPTEAGSRGTPPAEAASAAGAPAEAGGDLFTGMSGLRSALGSALADETGAIDFSKFRARPAVQASEQPFQPNYKRLALTPELKRFSVNLHRMMKDEILERKGKPRTHDATILAAEKMIDDGKMTAERILTLEGEAVLSREEMTAARMIAQRSRDFSWRANEGFKAGAIQGQELMDAFAVSAALSKNVRVAQTRVAQAQEASKIKVGFDAPSNYRPDDVIRLADDLGANMTPDQLSQALDAMQSAPQRQKALNTAAVFPRAFLELMYFSYLSGKAVLKNAFGNILMPPIEIGSMAIAPYLPRYGAKGQLTKVLPGSATQMTIAWGEGMLDTFRLLKFWDKESRAELGTLQDRMGGGRQIESRYAPGITAENFGGGQAMDLAGSVFRSPSNILGTTDALSKMVNARMWQRFEAFHQAAKEGLTDAALWKRVDDLVDDVTLMSDSARERVMDFAERQTLTKDFEGAFLSRLSRGPENEWLNAAYRWQVMPFFRTMVRGTEQGMVRTPGLNFLMKKFYDDLRAGGQEQQIAQARVLFGGAVLGTFGYLESQGLITGDGPTDPKLKKQWRDELGMPERSWWDPVSKKWRTYDGFPPLSDLMAAGADMSAAARRTPGDLTAMFTAGAVAMATSFDTKGYTRTLSEWFDFMRQGASDDSQWERFIELQRRRIAGVFSPGVLRELETGVDPEVRRARPSGAHPEGSTGNAIVRELRVMVDEWKSKIPGLSSAKDAEGNDLVPPDRDRIDGKPTLVETYPFNFFTAKTPTVDPLKIHIFGELLGAGFAPFPDWIGGGRPVADVGIGTRQAENVTAGVRMTPQERDRYAVLMTQVVKNGLGQSYREALTEATQDPMYQAESDLGASGTPRDSGKARWLQRIDEEFRGLAEERLLEEVGGAESKLGREITRRKIERDVRRQPTAEQPGTRELLRSLTR